MQKELQKKQYWGEYAVSSRNKLFVWSKWHGVSVLAEVLVSLRKASVAILGDLPATVEITAPYVLAWQEEETEFSSYIWKARKRAKLKSFPVETMSPLYLAEASTVLAANNQCLCQDRYCYGPEASDESVFMQEVVYYVRYVYFLFLMAQKERTVLELIHSSWQLASLITLSIPPFNTLLASFIHPLALDSVPSTQISAWPVQNKTPIPPSFGAAWRIIWLLKRTHT